jgi:NADH:ubiquinone oxidoreductase subunit B-like Fe-S oxidoreductase
MFNNYAIVQGVDQIVPVDMYVPGCPPRPEMLMDGILRLHEKIQKGEPRSKLVLEPEGSGEPRRGAPVSRKGSGEPRRGAPVGSGGAR